MREETANAQRRGAGRQVNRTARRWRPSSATTASRTPGGTSVEGRRPGLVLETAVDGDPVEAYGLPPRVGGHVAAPRPAAPRTARPLGGHVAARRPPRGRPRHDRPDPGDASATMRISTVTEDTGADARTRPGARDARCCLQATVCPPAHGPRPARGLRRPRLEREPRLRHAGTGACQLRQPRPAAAARRPGVARPLLGRAVAVPVAAAGVPVHGRPGHGGAHAGVYGVALPAAGGRRRAARPRCAAARAAGRHLQRPRVVEGADRGERAGRGGRRRAVAVPAVSAVLPAGRRAAGGRRAAVGQPGCRR